MFRATVKERFSFHANKTFCKTFQLLQLYPPHRNVTMQKRHPAGVLSPRMGRPTVCSWLLYFLVIITPFRMDSFQKMLPGWRLSLLATDSHCHTQLERQRAQHTLLANPAAADALSHAQYPFSPLPQDRTPGLFHDQGACVDD